MEVPGMPIYPGGQLFETWIEAVLLVIFPAGSMAEIRQLTNFESLVV
jgi:hypothetical protein